MKQPAWLRRRHFWLLLAFVALVDPAEAGGDTPRYAPPHETDGRRLFQTYCASCHGAYGQGSKIAPPLINVGAAGVDWYLRTGRMPLAAPEQEPANSPPFFSRRQIDALVAHVGSQGAGTMRGPAIPVVHAHAGDVVRGRQLFAQNCQACHGSNGEGNSVGFGWEAPKLYRLDSTVVAEAVRFGPGVMPRFGNRELDQHDLDSLVRYVGSLNDPTDRGGFSLGHIGPVTEGLVAWLLGLGVLLLVVRLIGTRA